MRLISLRAWSLIVLSATLQVAIFPVAGTLPFWRTALCWFALVPFLLAVLSLDRTGQPLRLRSVLYLGYFCGVLWYSGNCYWIYKTMYLYGGLPKPVAACILILFALYLGLYHALFAALIFTAGRSPWGRRGALCLAPFAWVAVELARARITGFPWDLLGNSQVDNLLVTRIAPFAGVLGISFFIVAANSAIASFFFRRTKQSRFIPLAAILVVVLLQFSGAGYSPRPVPNLPNTAVMMQENLEVGAVGREVRPLSRSDELDLFSNHTLQPTSPLVALNANAAHPPPESTVHPTIIIWPEAPSNLWSTDPTFRGAMSQLATQAQSPLIIGSLGVDPDSVSSRGYDLYDSASLFDPTGAYQGRYDKIHLVPWGEYIPFKHLFGFARKLTEGVGDMDPGHARTVFATGGHTYGIFVCYESIFGDEVRQFVRNGAEVLVNISDDGWYGDTGAPWQHLNMARMRAIENHRWVLRSTNTGITTAIDPQGRIAVEAPRHVRAAFAFHFAFEPATDQTFYTRHGDWFAYLCAFVTVATLAYSFFHSHRPS